MQRNAPVGFTKMVVKSMTRAEMVLKAVVSPHERARDYVEQYGDWGAAQQLPVSDAVEFQMLGMKGVRRTEQNQLLGVGILQHREAAPRPVSRPVLSWMTRWTASAGSRK